MTLSQACNILGYNSNRPLVELKALVEIRIPTLVRPALKVSVAIKTILAA